MGRQPQAIFLIGYRGTGKTTVAGLLAQRLGWTALDADEVLETRFGRSIQTIFAEEGEPGFREKEAAILNEICQLTQHVIATGGGAILEKENRERMRATGHIVWLSAAAPTLWDRLQRDSSTAQRRPALTQGGLAEIEELLKARQPLYAACADLTIDTTARTPEEVTAAILTGMSISAPDPTKHP